MTKEYNIYEVNKEAGLPLRTHVLSSKNEADFWAYFSNRPNLEPMASELKKEILDMSTKHYFNNYTFSYLRIHIKTL